MVNVNGFMRDFEFFCDTEVYSDFVDFIKFKVDNSVITVLPLSDRIDLKLQPPFCFDNIPKKVFFNCFTRNNMYYIYEPQLFNILRQIKASEGAHLE